MRQTTDVAGVALDPDRPRRRPGGRAGPGPRRPRARPAAPARRRPARARQHAGPRRRRDRAAPAVRPAGDRRPPRRRPAPGGPAARGARACSPRCSAPAAASPGSCRPTAASCCRAPRTATSPYLRTSPSPDEHLAGRAALAQATVADGPHVAVPLDRRRRLRGRPRAAPRARLRPDARLMADVAALASQVALHLRYRRGAAMLDLHERALAATNNGIVIADADPDGGGWPVSYVNEAFELLTGYRVGGHGRPPAQRPAGRGDRPRGGRRDGRRAARRRRVLGHAAQLPPRRLAVLERGLPDARRRRRRRRAALHRDPPRRHRARHLCGRAGGGGGALPHADRDDPGRHLHRRLGRARLLPLRLARRSSSCSASPPSAGSATPACGRSTSTATTTTA